jgi:hypothetical protein
MNTRILLTATLALCLGTAHAQRVANAEYFWDTDPGAGSATTMNAVDGTFDSAVEAIFMETSTLPGAGAHTLGIRVRDQQNNWGPTFTTVVVVEPSLITAPEIKVTQAEYFWDIDPGQGNATPMIAFDGNFNDALEAISAETSALPASGVHVLHVRARDAVGVWSAPFRVVVEVLGGVVTFPEIHVAAAEYYVNEDPGPGNGTPMLAVDNDFNAALEAIRGGGIPVPVIAGVNVLWLRAKDVNDAWGPSFGVVVNIDTTITGTVGVPTLLANDMHLWPNPARADEGFTIAFDRAVGNVQVRVLDAAGRVVHEQRAQQERRVQVALHGAAPGVYHVGVVVDGAPHWQRVVLQ